MRARQTVGLICLAAAALTACGCGGSSSPSPTAPTVTPVVASPTISIELPSPLEATLQSSSDSTSTYEVRATVTFRETGGAVARLTRVQTTVVRLPSGESSGVTLDVSLTIPAFGSAADVYAQTFDVGSNVDEIRWRFSVEYQDSSGRTFMTPAVEARISPPSTQPPSVPPATPNSRLLVYGGRGYEQYLGCFSCDDFHLESVFNQFGRYGSRFSQTSIWNHFSSFGSQFSNDSACNQFATNPPILVDEAADTYSEITLNLNRQYAIREPRFVAWLRTTVCEL